MKYFILFMIFKELFNENEWKNLNKKNFEYSKCSTCSDKVTLSNEETKGFFTEYSKSTPSEDMAEVFSHLMFYQNENDNF